jgi:prephenate dehydratase
MIIGYLGPAGSYSHEAACRYAEIAGETVNCVALPSFAAIVDGVEQGRFGSGIIPVENSTHGAVATAMDTLLNLQKGTVCGEVVLNIEHCLLSTSGNLADLHYVYSHEQALEQCRRFFHDRCPQIELVSCSSTSQACELAGRSGAAYGAVAGKTAASFYGLRIALQNIQDNVFNQTRFLIIGAQQAEPTGRDKTSIAFAFPGDRPGSLYKILKSFADRSINLTRIESRPAKHMMGKYMFHIDFLGHRQEEAGSRVLREVAGQVEWLKILGSYPIDASECQDRQDTQGEWMHAGAIATGN